MKNKLLATLAIAVLVAAILLAGRGAAGVTAASEPPVNVNLNNQQGIWVTGEGKLTITPDIAVLSLGVSARAATVVEAQSQAAAAMARVMSALTASGVNPNDVQTQYYNIQQVSTPLIYPVATPATVSPRPAPILSLPPTPQPSPTVVQKTQYEVNNQVTVKIRAVDRAGATIDAVAAAGGDNIRINGISFTLDQPGQYNARLRELAMQDAQAKAQALAQLSGVTLGKVFYVVENSSYPLVMRQYPVFKGVDMAVPAPTLISPGQSDMTLTVQVAYTIQ